jgi:hypothetical protein
VKQRGRKSLAAVGGAVALIERPDAPLDLTPEETDVWHDTVEALPADWFPRETHPLLVQWCRHTVASRRVSQLIDAAYSRDEVDVGELKDLLRMQAQETAALKAMASAMRISQQASYSHRSADTAKSKRVTVTRPWD